MLTDRFHFQPPPLSQWSREVDRDPEPTWLIPNILPSDNLVLCSGQPKEAKKSWFCMLQAMICASGVGAARMQSQQKVAVLYIYREGARRATLQRFAALSRGHDLPSPYELDNLYIHHRGAFMLDDEDWIESVINFIWQHSIKLVFIDTFAKSFGSDENNAQHVGKAIRQAENIRDQKTTVVLVHHPRKAKPTLTGEKEGYPDPDHDLRGSTSLAGSYETHHAIRTYNGDQMMIVSSKEGETAAYAYEWEFLPDAQGNLMSARLLFERRPEMPYISAPTKSRSKASEGIFD